MLVTHDLAQLRRLLLVCLCVSFVFAAGVNAQAQQENDADRDGAAAASDGVARLLAEIRAGEPEPTVEPTDEELAVIQEGGKRMTAVETPAAPVLDGLVDDDVWELADVVTDFLQREPVEAAPASQRTEVRILYDKENLYLGFIMHDDEPDQIKAQDLRRDSRLDTDDTIAVLFDTFHDHRNGFLFRVNPLGTKYDTTLKDESQLNSSWDETWEAAAQITDSGWQVEMAIPFKALRFPAGSHVWGIDFKREIRRNSEEVNWSNYRQDFDFRAISQGGHLLGLRDSSLTDRFRVTPYLSGAYTALNAADTPFVDKGGEIGIETFKAQITTNLTADATVNTDFAQVEDDAERVNLTRFPLFFQERRDFFLEGADKFQFGAGGRDFGTPLAVLYHSRNIGLFDGQPVPMTYGVKTTGKMGSTSVGLINAQDGRDSVIDYAGGNYSTVRVKQDILERSSIGMIFTNVQNGGDYNRVGGVDANFRFFDNLSVGGYVAQARDSDVEGSQYIGRFSAGWNSDLWGASASVDYIDPNFETDMGFILRRDLVKQSYSANFSPRPNISWLRQITVWGSLNYLTDTQGEITDREQSIFIRPQFESGDSLSISASRNFERLEYGFNPGEIATVDPGDYDFTEWRVSLESFRARKLSGRLSVSGGGYYGGTRRTYGASATVRFNEKFSLSPRYDFNRIEHPSADFDTHVGSMRATYNFNERLLTSALVQYNSLAERVSVFARIRYIYRTGDDFYLVYKSSTRYDLDYSGVSDHGLIAKFTRSFDF
jgi:hypothetical protein